MGVSVVLDVPNVQDADAISLLVANGFRVCLR